MVQVEQFIFPFHLVAFYIFELFNDFITAQKKVKVECHRQNTGIDFYT